MIVTPIIATVLVFVISALVKIYKTDRQPEASGEDMQLEAVNEWIMPECSLILRMLMRPAAISC